MLIRSRPRRGTAGSTEKKQEREDVVVVVVDE